jgi:hypothetical protein
MSEKQQHLEGPWNRVGGSVPLSEFELEGWKDNLDKMYGEEHWRAVPTNEQSKQFYIAVSPDTDSVYAGMARSFDKQGMLDDPYVQEILAKRALEEHGPVTDPSTVKPRNPVLHGQNMVKDPTDPLGENPDFSNPATIHNLLVRTSGFHKGSHSPLERTVVAGFSNVAEGLVSQDLTEQARAIRATKRMIPALNPEGQKVTFETATHSPEEIKAGLVRVLAGFTGEQADHFRDSFGIPAPAEDNQLVKSESVFKPEEETVALGLIGLGFAVSKNAEKQHKVLTPGYIYSGEHIDMLTHALAQDGHIQGSAEEQAAMVSGVKYKLLTQLQGAIKANEQIISSLRKETPSGLKGKPGSELVTNGASESVVDPAHRQERVLSDKERELYRKIGILLANNLGLMWRPSPKQPSGMSANFRWVDQELAALRSEGQSEKKALHTLAKKYHSDTNHEPGVGEKIRVVTQRLEELNRRGSK